jgi:hypothetical protein
MGIYFIQKYSDADYIKKKIKELLEKEVDCSPNKISGQTRYE